MLSLWEDTTKMPAFKNLGKDIKTDVLVIGGGMAGVLCAYMLNQAGVDYTLVEANNICGGITKNTTAKITAQHGLLYHKLISEFGAEKAKQYLDMNLNAVDKFRELCSNINCDFENKDSYVYSLESKDFIDNELAALRKLGYKADFAGNIPLPFSIAGAVRFKNQA